VQHNKPSYRTGTVGCGTISGIHARDIAASDRAVLVTAHSRTDAKREAFCAEFGITGYSGYDGFLAGDLDVVVLCTPNGTHLDNGLQPPVSGEESLELHAFVKAAYRSAEQQVAVSPEALTAFTSSDGGG
jgi:ornithine cyclodeaminase/alanine dehydrogenase-like protein (mu-crystallin family)